MNNKNELIRHFLTAIVVSTAIASGVFGQSRPGDLDLTFSGDGKLTDLFPGSIGGLFYATAVQPDGKIIAVGTAIIGPNPNYDFAVFRYNADGSLDTSFDGDGRVTTQISDVYPYEDSALTVAVQPDGKIVVAGWNHPLNSTLVRYNTDGSLDNSFGSGGKVISIPIGEIYKIAIQADGKIVVAGSGFSIARYNPNGSLDSTFGTGGIVRTDFGNDLQTAHSVTVQSDGKIVAAGDTGFYDCGKDGTTCLPFFNFALARYNTNGSLDTTFDGDGIVITRNGTGFDPGFYSANSIAIQTDGKIVAGGTADSPGTDHDFAVVRYQANGSLDATFDGDGIATTSLGPVGSSVAIQLNSKIVVAGTSSNGSNNDFAVVRYLPNGSLDTTFGGGDGKTTVDFGNSTERAEGMAIDDAGRAVVVGGSDGKFAIARFLLTSRSAPFDFDGDGRTDTTVFRPSEGKWYLNRSTEGINVVSWGLNGDQIMPGDYDGDGKTDTAVYRNGSWYVINSGTNTISLQQWGVPLDIPVSGDYDGDGQADRAVFRRWDSDSYWLGQWHVLKSSGGIWESQFGPTDGIPIAADYDGDGLTDRAFYSDGEWQIYKSGGGTRTESWGLSGDIAVPADFDGNGSSDIAVYRPTEGRWYIRHANGNINVIEWGLLDDIPVPGDYDGDGRSDSAVFRDGTWYVLGTTSGIMIKNWGLSGDIPVPAASQISGG